MSLVEIDYPGNRIPPRSPAAGKDLRQQPLHTSSPPGRPNPSSRAPEPASDRRRRTPMKSAGWIENVTGLTRGRRRDGAGCRAPG